MDNVRFKNNGHFEVTEATEVAEKMKCSKQKRSEKWTEKHFGK